jgi:hypothetical protein
MKKTVIALCLAASLSSIAHAKIELDANSVKLSSAEQVTALKQVIMAKVVSKYGMQALSASEQSNIDIAVYVHPAYIEQSYQLSKTAASVDLKIGGQFVLNRVNGFIAEINNALSTSGINATVNLSFVSAVGASVPILSSTGVDEYTMPDGIKKINTDAEFFQLLLEDYGNDSTRYGISAQTRTRRVKAATGADLHIFLRPHYSNGMITDGYAAPGLGVTFNSKVGHSDGPIALSYELGTMTLYDYYWNLGYQDADPSASYIYKTASHEFGHVMQAGHEDGSGSPFSYGKAATCAGATTIMGKTITATTLPFFSSPDLLNDGVACGGAIATANEADNKTVVSNNIPLVAGYAEKPNPGSSVSLSTTTTELSDANLYGLLLTRTGDLSGTAFVTLVAESSSATEGYLHPVTGAASEGADFIFGLPTIEFVPGQDIASVQLRIPDRQHLNQKEQFYVHLQHAANTAIDEQAKSILFSIEENQFANVKVVSIFESSTVGTEGGTASLSLQRSGSLKGNVDVKVSSIDGTARAGVHYILNTAQASFTDGDTSFRYIDIALLDDGQYNEDMYFDISISSDNAEVANSVARVKINEISAPKIGTVTAQDANVVIDNLSGEAVIKLKRAGGSDAKHIVTLRPAAGSTAIEGFDYSLPGEIIFAHKEVDRTATIKMLNAKTKTINFEIFSASLNTVTGSGSVTVEKSATLPNLAVSSNVTTLETSEFAPIILNRSDSKKELKVNLKFVNGTALSNIDYKPEPAIVTMPVGTSSLTVKIPVIDRKDTNGDRTFTVSFESDEVNIPLSSTIVTVKDVARTGKEEVVNEYAGALDKLLLLLLPLLGLRRRKRLKAK